MGTIALEGLEFFSYHGFYAEEQKMGNRYSVDVTIEVDFERAAIDDKLSETVNYEKVYAIVAEIMQQSHKLLEHIAYHIITGLRARYPRIARIEVGVSKFNPPVGGVCERARGDDAGMTGWANPNAPAGPICLPRVADGMRI